MLRLLTAPLACVFLVIFLVIGFGAVPVQGETTYKLVATSKHVPLVDGHMPDAGDFIITYITDDPLGRFSLGAAWWSFSELATAGDGGHGEPLVGCGYGGSWSGIEIVPVYSLASPYTDGQGKSDSDMPMWGFTRPPMGVPYYPTEFTAEATAWTYERTPYTLPVPIPPSVFLLGAGLIGLAVARRKKRLGP